MHAMSQSVGRQPVHLERHSTPQVIPVEHLRHHRHWLKGRSKRRRVMWAQSRTPRTSPSRIALRLCMLTARVLPAQCRWALGVASARMGGPRERAGGPSQWPCRCPRCSCGSRGAFSAQGVVVMRLWVGNQGRYMHICIWGRDEDLVLGSESASAPWLCLIKRLSVILSNQHRHGRARRVMHTDQRTVTHPLPSKSGITAPSW